MGKTSPRARAVKRIAGQRFAWAGSAEPEPEHGKYQPAQHQQDPGQRVLAGELDDLGFALPLPVSLGRVPGFGLQFLLAAGLAGLAFICFLYSSMPFWIPWAMSWACSLVCPGFWLARAIFIASCWVSGKFCRTNNHSRHSLALIGGQYAITVTGGLPSWGEIALRVGASVPNRGNRLRG